MALGVVPDSFAIERRIAAIEKTVEESYKDRLASATPAEARQVKREMKREIRQAIKAEIEKAPWWQRGCPGPWIR
ncbi:MAG: hypothetical protein RBU21_22605 [FCB group bacterium]|jgi:hypothetical protein|nr:hypothetical protein [FCB group bacterium]